MKRTSWPSARSAHARWHEQSRKWPERGGGEGGGGGRGETGCEKRQVRRGDEGREE